LAHGFDISRDSGGLLLIVMSFFAFGPLLFRKNFKVPRGLWVSSIIPYVLILVNILQLSFGLKIPDVWGFVCFMAIVYLNFPLGFTFGTGGVFFFAAFIIDTLIIFGIIRLILYIKGKISAKKTQIRTANETN